MTEENNKPLPARQIVDINININVDSNQKTTAKRSELSDDNEPYEKIKTELTVPQLAYIFRLLLDLGIFKQRKRTDIMKFISDNFKTHNVEEISINSLRSKYYTTDEGSKQVIKDILIKMVNQINKG